MFRYILLRMHSHSIFTPWVHDTATGVVFGVKTGVHFSTLAAILHYLFGSEVYNYDNS